MKRGAVVLSLSGPMTVPPAAHELAAGETEPPSRRVTITVQSYDPETRVVSYRVSGDTATIGRATLTAGALEKASRLEPGKRVSVDLVAGEAGASIADMATFPDLQ